MPSPLLSQEMKDKKKAADALRHAKNREAGRPAYTDPERDRENRRRREQVRSKWRTVHREYLRLLDVLGIAR